MKIIKFEDKYRDDMIYMVLSAKNAIGRIPRINEDLLDIKANYFDKGHCFWLSIDEFDRVIGCIGTREDEEGNLFLYFIVNLDLNIFSCKNSPAESTKFCQSLKYFFPI